MPPKYNLALEAHKKSGSYQPFGVNISKAQLSKLVAGRSTRLKPDQLKGDHTLHLTSTQINRLQKAANQQKGALVKFSGAQLRYVRKVGKGLLDSMGISASKPKVPQYIAPVKHVPASIKQVIKEKKKKLPALV